MIILFLIGSLATTLGVLIAWYLVSPQDILGEDDLNHLQNATELGRVLCTHDTDFLQLASSGLQHSGLVFGQQDIHYISEWVNWLTLMHAVYTSEEMINYIEYL